MFRKDINAPKVFTTLLVYEIGQEHGKTCL